MTIPKENAAQLLLIFKIIIKNYIYMHSDINFDINSQAGKEIMGILGGLYVLILLMDIYRLYQSLRKDSSPIIFRQRIFYIIIFFLSQRIF